MKFTRKALGWKAPQKPQARMIPKSPTSSKETQGTEDFKKAPS